MTDITEGSLRRRLAAVENSLVLALEQGTESACQPVLEEWNSLAHIVGFAAEAKSAAYSDELYVLANRVAARIATVAELFRRILLSADHFHAHVIENVEDILRSSSPTKPAASRSTDRTGQEPFAALRMWFLQHIDYPYPCPDEKRALGKELGLTAPRITQFFTNARRRSGWMQFMKHFGEGDTEKTAQLIRRIKQTETSSSLRDAAISGSARGALVTVQRYVEAGLEHGIRDGLQEAMEEEMSRIAEEKARVLEQGEMLDDEPPARKRPRVQGVAPRTRANMGVPVADRIQRSDSEGINSNVDGDPTPPLSRASFTPDVNATESLNDTTDSILRTLHSTLSNAALHSNSQQPGMSRKRTRADFETIDHLPQGDNTRGSVSARTDAAQYAVPFMSEDIHNLEVQSLRIADWELDSHLNSTRETGPIEALSTPMALPSTSSSAFSTQPDLWTLPSQSAADTSLRTLVTRPSIPTTSDQAAWPFDFGQDAFHEFEPMLSVHMPPPRPWSPAPRASNAPSDVAPPTWSLVPAVSSVPKPRRRSPQKRALQSRPIDV